MPDSRSHRRSSRRNRGSDIGDRHRRLRPTPIPCDGRPLAKHEIRSARAITLAFQLCVLHLKNDLLPPAFAPIPDQPFDSRTAWLCRQLRPLAVQSRLIRDAIAILDENRRTAWDDPEHLAETMRGLMRAARMLIPSTAAAACATPPSAPLAPAVQR